ncbi:MAG: ribosome biogenesis GTPase Der, partial [Planctomycetota bacterium]
MTHPTVAIVGRPNVGKSTLFNRLAGRRVSIVHDRPGVTRDRIIAEIELDDRQIELIDTGGIGIVDRDDLSPDIHLQIDTAIASASVILFLVDARDGPQPLDVEVAERLRATEIPLIVLANKCETNVAQQGIGEFYRLGVGEPLPLSAEHNEGIYDLRERIVDALPPENDEEFEDPALKIAIVGRRNAGKSTLINAILDEERVIVSDIPGTTRDAVDVRFTKDDREFVAIDTAGMVRKAKLKDSVEFYAQQRSLEAIRRAEVGILLLDAEHGVSQLDKRIASDIVSEYRACVIGVNKWDLVRNKTSMGEYGEYLSAVLPGLSYAPVVFLTAKDGRNIWDVISVAQSLSKQGRSRVSTGVLNRAVEKILAGPMPRPKHNTYP